MGTSQARRILLLLIAMIVVRCRAFPQTARRLPLLHTRRLASDGSLPQSINAGSPREPQEITPAEREAFRKRIKQHQLASPKPSLAEEARTLVEKSLGFATLATNSVRHPGTPFASMIGFSLDEKGRPFTIVSSLSSHTQDLARDGRCSLLVTENGNLRADSSRVTLVGSLVPVSDPSLRSVLRGSFLERHPEAFWIDFGDFEYFSMETIHAIRYIGAFARAASLQPEEYLAARPDPLLAFAEAVVKHMNDDHREAVREMVQHFVSVPCTKATLLSVDQYGMVVRADLLFDAEPHTLRLPFPHPIRERKAVKEAIVEMSRQASARKPGV